MRDKTNEGHKFRVSFPTRYPISSLGHRDTRARQGYYVEREEGVTDAREVASKLYWPVKKIDVEDLDGSPRVRRFLIYGSEDDKKVAEMAAKGVRGIRADEDTEDTGAPYLRLVENDDA